MLSILKATAAAIQTIQSPTFSQYDLSPATSLPLRLPDGWRFPYNAFREAFRMQQTMLILFVDDRGQVEVEWDDLALSPVPPVPGPPPILPPPPPVVQGPPPLPPLSLVLEQVRAKYPDARVETTEAVWDAQDRTRLCWRVGLMRGVVRFTVLVWGAADALRFSERASNTKSASGSDFSLGAATCEDGELTVNLHDHESLRALWTIWSCMAQVAEFTQALGYGDFGPHNVRVELVDSDAETPGAAFDPVRGVPTISFLRKGGWTEDLTIILHEMGHALWSLLFTRSPRHLKLENNKPLLGIEEGLADYFAATQLSAGQAMDIGGRLDPQAARVYKLPRTINGKFAAPDSDDPHEIGKQWANLLWNFRTQVGAQDADRVIIGAHIKPRVGASPPDNPLACYLQSLKETARRLAVHFDDWGKLANDHHIVA